jgi:hypothetical protein
MSQYIVEALVPIRTKSINFETDPGVDLETRKFIVNQPFVDRYPAGKKHVVTFGSSSCFADPAVYRSLQPSVPFYVVSITKIWTPETAPVVHIHHISNPARDVDGTDQWSAVGH